MVNLDFPILFISVLITFIGSLIFFLIDGKVKNKILSLVCLLLLLIPLITVFSLFLRYGLSEAIVEPPIFSHPEINSFSMYLDDLNAFFLLGVGLVSTMGSLYSLPYMEHRIKKMKIKEQNPSSLAKFYFFYTTFATSMIAFVLSNNLFLVHVFFVISLVSSAFLILSYGYKDRKRIGLIYLVWGGIAYYFFLLGAVGVGSIETYNILSLKEMNIEHISLVIPLFILISLSIKMALFGVHIWLPKAHGEAPAPVSALLSANLIGLSGYVMILVRDIFSLQFEILAPFLVVLGFITMVYGGLNAIAQDDLKRLLAYSSISQMGWITFGIATMTQRGMIGGVILFVTQSVASSVLFMSAGVLVSKYDGLRDISNMGELLNLNPILSSLVIIAFSILIGAPLTIGFWGKTLIFSGAMSVASAYGFVIFILIALAIIFAGGITASYSLITMKRMLFGTFKGGMESRSIGWSIFTIPMAGIASIGVFLFFVPEWLFGPAEPPSLSILTIEGLMFLTAYLGAYTIFSGAFRYFLVLFSHKVENEIIDRFFHERMISWIKRADKALEDAHPADFTTYLLWLVIGLVGVLLTVIFL